MSKRIELLVIDPQVDFCDPARGALYVPGAEHDMARLQFAAVPVDQDMAKKRRWGRMPLPELVARLDEKTGGRVLRSDTPAPPGVAGLTERDLYFELEL